MGAEWDHIGIIMEVYVLSFNITIPLKRLYYIAAKIHDMGVSVYIYRERQFTVEHL